MHFLRRLRGHLPRRSHFRRRRQVCRECSRVHRLRRLRRRMPRRSDFRRVTNIDRKYGGKSGHPLFFRCCGLFRGKPPCGHINFTPSMLPAALPPRVAVACVALPFGQTTVQAHKFHAVHAACGAAATGGCRLCRGCCRSMLPAALPLPPFCSKSLYIFRVL